jgi:hypothetical protein
MAPPETPERFATALRLTKAASLAFFSAGMAMAVAGVAAILVPESWKDLAYAAVGATTMLGAWKLLDYLFRTLEATKPRPKK